jgi:DNA-binding beta-propeller fold protein YncE
MKRMAAHPTVAPLAAAPIAHLRIATSMVALASVLVTAALADGQVAAAPSYTSPVATGARLDPVGRAIDLGNMPLAIALAPRGDKLAIVLSGWRQQGLQIVDLASGRVTQTLEQPAAFYGAAFSSTGRELYVSGGNQDAIYCYSWNDTIASFEREIVLGTQKPDKTGSRYPAGIARSTKGNLLYVAENVADSLVVIDPGTSSIVQRFPTDHYPYAVETAPDGMVYVSAWGSTTLSVFRAGADGRLRYAGRLRVGPHPSALVSNASGSRLFVALSEVDQIAIVDTRRRSVRYLSDAAPGAPSEGMTPNALALSHDESTLFVAEAGNNSVAVFDVSAERPGGSPALRDRLLGRLPTDWYPTGVVDVGHELLILSSKGHGSHANPDGPIPGMPMSPTSYTLGQLGGTLRVTPDHPAPAELAVDTRRAAAAGAWGHHDLERSYPPFKHVVYIIKENRTYDQVLGDVRQGDGDSSLVFFGQHVSPNHHALAARFGLFDRFFTSAEVSSQGHLWSTAADVTAYGEKMVSSSYSDRRADIDGEEIDEPMDGFLWDLAAKKGVTFRDYGEMVKTDGWPVTQRGLGPDISPTYPAFDLKIPDQTRADAWIAELQTFARDGNMPGLEILHLPNDHLAAGSVGYHTPRALMADNDLALGRIIEALSRSKFWPETVVFVLEDDAQAGPDHVDSHRSVLLVVSPYNRPGTHHRFINTVDVVAAIEDILHLGRLSKYDYFSRPLTDVFATTPDLSSYSAAAAQVDLNEMNAARTAAARLSSGLDFKAADRVNDAVLNNILWQMIKGPLAPPAVATRAPLHALQVTQ